MLTIILMMFPLLRRLQNQVKNKRKLNLFVLYIASRNNRLLVFRRRLSEKVLYMSVSASTKGTK